MTREERLDCLCRLRSGLVWFDIPPKERLMLEEALSDEIKALEQEPCEDCISRQATVERLCKVAEFMNEKRNGLGSPYVMAALFIQDNRDEFPPVTPKPKTGHWEQFGNSWEDKFKCSECGKEQPKILCGERIIGHWSDFCPNCGANMIESQESEDTKC